jgi:hypothetical protein
MSRIVVVLRRLDAFCARLNDGLAAVAVVLAMLTAIVSATYLEHNAERLLPSLDPGTELSSFDE